jgi:ribonucleoside-diphosphate reductase alpha chain
MSYTYDESIANSTEYFNGNDLSAKVFVDKYALRDNDGNILESNPSQMHWRLANEFARIENDKFHKPLSAQQIYDMLDKFRYIIPQGSPMYGIGNKYQTVSLSNCYVVDVHDSYGGICLTDQYITQISKRRGGIGYDISPLRPKDMSVQNAARTTTGAVSFMHRFSHTGREVGQAGRRAAQMITISVHYPDILDFIQVKNDEMSVTGANISVRLTDEFLHAVKNDEPYELRWPVDSKNPTVYKQISAKKVWDAIIHNAWLRAEPGLLFWDNIIRESPADCYHAFGFKTMATNPCSEIPLSLFDSCRLLALNLVNFVDNPYTSKAKFNYNKLHKYAMLAQRLMDDIVDLELECIDKIIAKIDADPEPKFVKAAELHLWTSIKTACINGRRTGTGITSLGDTMAALGLKYASKTSINTVGEIFKTIKLAAYRSSVDMAKELGAFPIWNAELEKDNPFLLRIKDEDEALWNDMQKYGRRNISLLTAAPTGSLSTVASLYIPETGQDIFNVSSGVEPCYATSYTRRKKVNHSDLNAKIDFVDKMGDKWTEFTVYHSGAEAWMIINDKKNDKGSPYEGSTAEEIDWQSRVKLQAEAQKHIDHAISSTINLPSDVEESEVAKIYETAWRSGCKGITVYRDGCRSGVLVKSPEIQKIPKSVAPERPKDLTCDVHHVTVKGKPYFVLVGLFGDEPYEVFAGKNGHMDKAVKKGVITRKLKPKCYKAVLEDDTEISPVTIACDENEEALTRMVSTSLRHGANVEFIVEQLGKVSGDLNGFCKALSRALKHYIPNGVQTDEKCQNCSTILVYKEGCKSCQSCGWSKCN